jgi:hypothetical protein
MKKQTLILPVILLVIASLACQVAGYNVSKNTGATAVPVQPTILVVTADSPSTPATETPAPPTAEPPTAEPPTAEPPTAEPPTAEPPTAVPTIEHKSIPPEQVPNGQLVYDVVSKDTAPEKRAPYGDAYQINRLERPFLQDMTYVPDLDIASYNFLQDANWTYVSVQLVGTDPNNKLGINYGVEIDSNADGFGEYLILAKPPYSPKWATTDVQVYQDKNHDTSGLSAEKSDAPFTGDGYETLIFDGSSPKNDDPDLAWVRINASADATIQFAFKRSFPNKWFMLGVFADAGLKDQTKLDYVDRFSEADAGSPVRGNKNYPLKSLNSVDNACREALGFTPTGYEPQLCPRTEPTPKPGSPGITPGKPWFIITPFFCIRPAYCTGSGYAWDQKACRCNVIIY